MNTKFLSNPKCHDVYTLECTDEYETSVFMVGRSKYYLTELTYPEETTHLLDSEDKLIFNVPTESILSVDNDNDNLCIHIMTDSGERVITLNSCKSSKP